jgi:hypothetical protein
MHSAAGGTSQRLKPAVAIVRSRSRMLPSKPRIVPSSSIVAIVVSSKPAALVDMLPFTILLSCELPLHLDGRAEPGSLVSQLSCQAKYGTKAKWISHDSGCVGKIIIRRIETRGRNDCNAGAASGLHTIPRVFDRDGFFWSFTEDPQNLFIGIWRWFFTRDHVTANYRRKPIDSVLAKVGSEQRIDIRAASRRCNG